jgi:hypothetical protein
VKRKGKEKRDIPSSDHWAQRVHRASRTDSSHDEDGAGEGHGELATEMLHHGRGEAEDQGTKSVRQVLRE